MGKTFMHRDIQSIDTNVLLRLIIGDVPSQRERAINLILNGYKYYVSKYTIAEAVFTMERGGYKMPRARVVDNLVSILTNKCIVYDEEFFSKVFQFYLAHPRLSFVDCLLGFEAVSEQCEPIWTFDEDFAKQSQAAKLVP